MCKVEDGIFHYMGRNDFQVRFLSLKNVEKGAFVCICHMTLAFICEVKISGVRIECEEVSAVLKAHPVVADALVTASWLRSDQKRRHEGGQFFGKICLERVRFLYDLMKYRCGLRITLG